MVGFLRAFNDLAQHIVPPLGNPCPARSARARRMRSTGHGGGGAITEEKLGCAASEGGGSGAATSKEVITPTDLSAHNSDIDIDIIRFPPPDFLCFWHAPTR